MKFVRMIVCVAALTGLAACASYDPAKVELAAGSQKAVVLLEVAPSSSADVQLNLALYDEPNKTVLNTSFTGYANFTILPGVRYVAQTVEPGTYTVASVSQQMSWAACMHDNTLAFDVKPGEVLYLGRFNPALQILYIQLQAHTKGQLASRQDNIYFYFDNVPPLSFEFVGGREAQLAVAQQYVRSTMQKVSAPVRLADFRPAKFGTGYSLFGDRVCTGYFKNKVGEARPASQ